MCELTGAKYTNGKSKTLQLESLGETGFRRFFDFEKVAYGKYIINQIYDTPLQAVDNRDSGNTAVYLLYIELILLKYLSVSLNREVRFSQGKLWKMLGMVNNNYNNIEPIELKEKHESITDYEINNFYLRANTRLSGILNRALKNLSDRSLISAIPETIICKMNMDDKTFFVANDEEIAIILKTKRQIMDELGFDKESNIIFSKKKKEYYSRVNKILLDRYNWKFYYKAYRIIFNREDIKRFIPRIEMNLKDAMKEFNNKVVETLNDEASSLFDKNLQAYNDGVSNAASISEYYEAINQFRYPQDYVIAQKHLADELISINSEQSVEIDSTEDDADKKEIDDLFDD